MPTARKSPTPVTESLFSLPVPFTGKKTTPQRAPRQASVAPSVAVALAPVPVVAPSAAPGKAKRKRLSKAFDRPLDKILKQKARAALTPPKKAEKATVRDSFAFPKVEHERLVELKKRLAEQGITARKSDLIRVGLILALSIPTAKLKAVLAKLPPVK